MSENRLLLSVCIPTFNRAEYLSQSLECFVSQIKEVEGDLIEIVVNDNASTDSTRAIVSSLAEKYPFLHYFRNYRNIGAERNLFKVAQKARGTYIWIFGDDDLLTDHAIKKIMPYLSDAKYDFFMTNKIVKNRDLSQVVIQRQSPLVSDFPVSDIKVLCAEFGFFTNLGFLSTSIFRREPFIRVDPKPYIKLGTNYPQNGVLLDAFCDRPCLYISDVLVCHRQFNSPSLYALWPYIGTVPLIRLLRILEAKGKLEFSFIEQIKESFIGREPCMIGDIMLDCLEEVINRRHAIQMSDFKTASKIFESFKSEPYKDRFTKLRDEYQSGRKLRLGRRVHRFLYLKLKIHTWRVRFLVKGGELGIKVTTPSMRNVIRPIYYKLIRISKPKE